MDTPSHIYLASASPRRRELLFQIGVDHVVKATDVDESIRTGETAGEYVTRLALAKAVAGWQLLENEQTAQSIREATLVIGSDTCIALDKHLLGKPANTEQARDMLSLLSGNCHQVFSAVAILDENEYNLLSRERTTNPDIQVQCLRINETIVNFKALSGAEIEAYLETGESIGKAGAYAIQGRAAGFISRIEGSYSSVMGLPLYETAELLRAHGIEPLCSK